MQRGRQVRNIQTLPILAIEVDCKRKKSDPRRCARHNGRVRENPGRQQAYWGFLIRCTNLTQPTGALDSRAAQMLLETFRKMNHDMHSTILMVTHDAFSASYCSRILFLKDGKIFHELVRGVEERREFLNKILDVLSLTGGELSDVR